MNYRREQNREAAHRSREKKRLQLKCLQCMAYFIICQKELAFSHVQKLYQNKKVSGTGKEIKTRSVFLSFVCI